MATNQLNEQQRQQLGEQRHRQGVPFSRYQYVDVTFQFANRDTVVDHTLDVSGAPEDVSYVVSRVDRATNIYDDQSSTRRAWTANSIVLRSSVAGAIVRLLLTVPTES